MKKNFKADMILNKKFSNEISGYDATEVDEFFDKVIEDYRMFEERTEALNDTIEEDMKVIAEKDVEINKLKMELNNLKDQLQQTEKATNAELMKEIRDIKSKLK